jgi:hypothetical protein
LLVKLTQIYPINYRRHSRNHESPVRYCFSRNRRRCHADFHFRPFYWRFLCASDGTPWIVGYFDCLGHKFEFPQAKNAPDDAVHEDIVFGMVTVVDVNESTGNDVSEAEVCWRVWEFGCFVEVSAAQLEKLGFNLHGAWVSVSRGSRGVV